MKNAVFWDVVSCRSWFGSHLLTFSSFSDFYSLNMEATCSSETSVLTRPTRRHIPEDGILLNGIILESVKIILKQLCIIVYRLILFILKRVDFVVSEMNWKKTITFIVK
jgi:hypothetical protein